MIHELKILPEYFQAVADGRKKFEIRFTLDRNFHEGDTVILQEWKSDKGYTGFQLTKEIGFITDFGQKPGYVVFGLV
jgi:ASC-1-like (ASCH) protein